MVKIQDESEVLRWFEEGKPYEEMREIYRTKYNIETSQSLWSAFRRRKGLDRRNIRDEDLIPWTIQDEHRWLHAPKMLRAEARLRAGLEVSEANQDELEAFKERLEHTDRVVYYDPDTEEGFFYVPRRPGIDDDMVRKPDSNDATRRSAD